MDQQRKAQEALGRSKVMALHQVIASELRRQWTLIHDRDYREKSPINRALKRIEQLNVLVNDGCMDSERYRKKFQELMQYIEALALYDFVSEEILQKIGLEVDMFPGERDMAATLEFIGTVQGKDL